jgi:hypothetical protein
VALELTINTPTALQASFNGQFIIVAQYNITDAAKLERFQPLR